MKNGSGPASTVLQMRSSFDRTYAAAPASDTDDLTESLLAIRLAGHPYAIRAEQTLGLICDRKVVPVPGGAVELLGIAAIRGALVPVYNLAGLVGHQAANRDDRWFVLCNREDPVGLSFGDFEGFFKAFRSQIHAAEEKQAVGEHVAPAIDTADAARIIINLSSIVETIRRRGSEGRVSRER